MQFHTLFNEVQILSSCASCALKPILRHQNLVYAGKLQGVDWIQMEELIAVKGEISGSGAILKDPRDHPNTRPHVCDGLTQMLTSNETALLRCIIVK